MCLQDPIADQLENGRGNRFLYFSVFPRVAGLSRLEEVVQSRHSFDLNIGVSCQFERLFDGRKVGVGGHLGIFIAVKREYRATQFSQGDRRIIG
jgi:hypothetical protein